MNPAVKIHGAEFYLKAAETISTWNGMKSDIKKMIWILCKIWIIDPVHPSPASSVTPSSISNVLVLSWKTSRLPAAIAFQR